jgi:CcmD family protein
VIAVTMAEVKYVAAAYLVVFLFLLAYLLIHATKLARLEREVAELTERVRARTDGDVAELTERVRARADG